MNPRLDEVCRAVRREFRGGASKDRWWLLAEPVRGGIHVRLRGRLGERDFVVRDGECPRDRANIERRAFEASLGEPAERGRGMERLAMSG